MSFLRSSLFLALVSLLVLTGYGYDLVSDRCDDAQHEQAQHGHAPADGEDGCQCVCHAPCSAPVVEGLTAPAAVPATEERFAVRDEIPPEAVPLGIDYPPQLA